MKLELGAHHGWENIDGGEDKVGIGKQVVGGLLMELLFVMGYIKNRGCNSC